MYKTISELENEHKRFRRKIVELELGANVNVLTRTIPVQKSIDVYQTKISNQPGLFNDLIERVSHSIVGFLDLTLDEFFATKPEIPLLKQEEYRPIVARPWSTDEPLNFESSIDHWDVWFLF